MSRWEQRAETFAAGYEPAAEDHPDLESRVVMYRRAAKEGRPSVVRAHARTLVRFAEHTGHSTEPAADELRGAELDAALADAGLPTTGRAAEKRARLAEYRTAQE